MRRPPIFALHFDQQDLTEPGTYYSRAFNVSLMNSLGVQVTYTGAAVDATLSLQVSFFSIEPYNGVPAPSSTNPSMGYPEIGTTPAGFWVDVPSNTATLSTGGIAAFIDSVETNSNWARVKIVVGDESEDLAVVHSYLVGKTYGSS